MNSDSVLGAWPLLSGTRYLSFGTRYLLSLFTVLQKRDRYHSAMLDDLRLHHGKDTRPNVAGEFVLYLMQGVVLRARGNFGLNFAVERANELGLPVLVYQGLRPDYPWANDRIHTFILESVADLQRDFEKRELQYVFYLETQQRAQRTANGEQERQARSPLTAHRSPLVRLAQRAALVVTDFFPTFIIPRQTKRLREKVDTPVIAVDSSCVVPMQYFTEAHATARGFRPRLLEAAEHYLHAIADPEPVVRRRIDVGFDSTAVGDDIAALVAACPIDHSVPPVRAIRGGRRAALRRLKHFAATGLKDYSDARGDPNRDVTSRLSPYLHFGNLSPHEILLAVREAAPAAEYARFQDELLTWRELAHNFCYHDSRHRTVSPIPGWARKELDDHLDDPRPELYSATQLERAETGNELWNACQRAYLRDGFMHNYLRMLWGKSILLWTRDYGSALRTMEELNNKYSLDGRDPSSYAGFHWCLGKFDRPFYPRPIFGLVRYMSLKAARNKFDAEDYMAKYPAEKGGTDTERGRRTTEGERRNNTNGMAETEG